MNSPASLTSDSPLLLHRDGRGVATLTMNRPEVHNAFDDALLVSLTQALQSLGNDRDVRVVVLTGAGKSFSAGADLNWMRRVAKYTEEQNYHDAMALGELMSVLNSLPKPTIARVNGAAFGGGVGLVVCCDIGVACAEAQFSLSETRLGLIPAVISPYVVSAMGEKQARRYFLTAERFGAEQALRMRLVHEVVPLEDLDAAVNKVIDRLLQCGPNAQTEAKDLIASVVNRPATDSVVADTAERIAHVRASPEGQEGLSAFLEKREPNWIKKR
jgi:methylglutaconyl-CoA hydratase